MPETSTVFEKNAFDMAREDIVAALHKKGLTLRALSILNGYKPTTLNNALNGPYEKAEQIIAKALGVEVRDIWPEREARRERKRDLKKRLEMK
ncbi:helix-turn-helix transcriptional regulator [Vibrio sp. YMD68]|uniref:helix-turn-helix domain-containing protein n=1 Tax=Vibrio sp. YMD68 TaxID=3042300 RepID=UPI00249C3417|nr:helix-turn-helix transcriptional regulator [Vibrio sp. YMD68]WGW01577.1 helix-turn-helix transcriptional regulator [Vibrio sp. YMD68]